MMMYIAGQWLHDEKERLKQPKSGMNLAVDRDLFIQLAQEGKYAYHRSLKYTTLPLTHTNHTILLYI